MVFGGLARPLSPPELFGGFGGGAPEVLGLAQPGTNGTVPRLIPAEVHDRTPLRLDEGDGRCQALEEAGGVDDPTAHDREQRLDLGDPLLRNLEEVVAQYGEVRVVARAEDALDVLLAREQGTADGARGEAFGPVHAMSPRPQRHTWPRVCGNRW